METEKTGVQYPTVQIGDATYEIRFTAETMYDLGLAGIAFNPKWDAQTSTWSCDFTNMCQVLKVVIGFPGTARELAGLVFDTRDDIVVALIDGWGKVVLPSLQRRTAAAKARQEAKLMQESGATQQPV